MPHGSAREDWNTYPDRAPEAPLAEPLASRDGGYLRRVKLTLDDHTLSFGETMENVTRLANEWRAAEALPRERERLARLIFHTVHPGSAWSDADDLAQVDFRRHAQTLLEHGYRKVTH